MTAFKSRLDDLEDMASHGLLRIVEYPELWVRRRPRFYLCVGVAVLLVAGLL